MFDLKNLTKFRTELMGFAMIMVVLFHSLSFSGIPLFDSIKKIGYLGVDIFLFFSGFGLYYSLVKDASAMDFYRKRILRILPFYIPIVFIYTLFLVLMYNHSPLIILTNITGIAFFTQVFCSSCYHFDWYILSLLLLYLIAPIYFRFFRVKPRLCTFGISVLAIFISIVIFWYIPNFDYLLVFTVRIPIFLIGLYMGKIVYEGTSISNNVLSFLLLLFVIGSFWLGYNIAECSRSFLFSSGLYSYPLILMILPLLLILGLVFSKIGKSKLFLLTLIGQYTLPIYLIQERTIFTLMSLGFSYWVINVLAILITIVLAYFYQKIISSVMVKIGFT